MMLGQASVMEYLALVMMIVFIALVAVLLVFGFQIFTAGSQQQVSQERKSLFMLQSFISSTALTNLNYQQGSVFDDSKLTAASCSDMEKMFGEGIFVNISVIPDEGVCNNMPSWRQRICLENLRRDASTLCTTGVYPNCNIWTYCEHNKADRMIYRSIPVNIYRKMNGTIQLGSLTVGIESYQGGI